MPDSVEDLRRSLRKLRADIDRGSVPLLRHPKTDPDPITPSLPVPAPELEVVEERPSPGQGGPPRGPGGFPNEAEDCPPAGGPAPAPKRGEGSPEAGPATPTDFLNGSRTGLLPEAGVSGIRFSLIAEILGLGAAALGCWFDYGPLSAGGLSLVLAAKLSALRSPAGARGDASEDA